MKRRFRKFLTSALAVMMAVSVFAPAGAFADTAANAAVADGTYSIPVKLMHAYQNQESMGNNSLRQVGKLEVTEGKGKLTLSFKPMEFANLSGYLMEFNRITSFTPGTGGSPELSEHWEKAEPEVLSFFDVVDRYNAENSEDPRCAGKKYMKTAVMDIDLPEAADETTYTWIQVYVPVMGELAQGEQAARLQLDFSKLEKWEEPSVELNQTSASLTEGQSLQLKAAVSGSGDGEVVWSSSSDSVASVSGSGLVNAKKAGTAVITAEANNAQAICELTVKAKNMPVTAPKAPTGIKAAGAGYNKVKISWGKVSGASGYSVYQYNSSSKKYTLIANTTASSYTKSGLNCGAFYRFRVAAYKVSSDKKVYGAYSRVVSAKPILPAPKSVKAKAGKKSARVSWAKTAGASGYKVYRATKKKGKYKAVKTIKNGRTVKFTNKKLKKGRKYFYKVKAYRNVGKKKVYSSFTGKAAAVKVR